MFRIKDIEPLAPKANFAYGIQWRDKSGEPHMCEDFSFFEDYHREVTEITILDDYDENGLPQIIYILKDPESEPHYEPELIIPLTLKEFMDHLATTAPNPIPITLDVDPASATFVLSFKLIPDPERKKPPKMEITTNTTVLQIKLPTDYE